MMEYSVYSCLIILVYCSTSINSQLRPEPPRFTIAAVGPTPVRQPIQYRNERLVSVAGPHGGFLRARRPLIPAPAIANTLPPFPNPNSLNDDAKPVTEENESAEGATFVPQQQIPQVHTLQQQQTIRQSLPSVLYTTNENGEVLDHHHPVVDFQSTPRFVQPIQHAEIVPTTIRTTGSIQRFGLSPDRPVQAALQGTTKPPQLRARPEYREPRPQFEAKELAQPLRRPQSEYLNVKPRQHHDHEDREKKPVAQILRKYREENEDGTITWGFENDDGSFKEEIIGIDCITRGRYGYVDPDGMKREYNYETGIACDPSKRDQEEQEEENEDQENKPHLQDNGAYIDYQENQMVLSNGQRININNNKLKARRPAYQNN